MASRSRAAVDRATRILSAVATDAGLCDTAGMSYEVKRERYCRPDVTLETCSAVQFQLTPGAPWRSIIIWRDPPQNTFRPVDRTKRLRDLRPGDEVIVKGKRETIYEMYIYR